MSPLHLLGPTSEPEPKEILFLDFYRKVDEEDRKYVRDLISDLFKGDSDLKVEEGDSDTCLKVTGDDPFEIKRLRDAFERGVKRKPRESKSPRQPVVEPEIPSLRIVPDEEKARDFLRNAYRKFRSKGESETREEKGGLG